MVSLHSRGLLLSRNSYLSILCGMQPCTYLVFHINVIDEGVEELEGEAYGIDQGDGGIRFLDAIEQPEGTTEIIQCS